MYVLFNTGLRHSPGETWGKVSEILHIAFGDVRFLFIIYYSTIAPFYHVRAKEPEDMPRYYNVEQGKNKD